MKVLEFKDAGIAVETVLKAAAQCAQEEGSKNVLVVLLDSKNTATIFASSMRVSQYAFVALVTQDLAQSAMHGQIIDEDPEPQGGPKK